MLMHTHMSGGAPFLKKYKLGATVASIGVIAMNTATTGNIIPSSTTSFADAVGLAVDTDTYTTTQATILSNLNAGRVNDSCDAFITVSARPDLIIRAQMTGAATENTTLALLTNTSAASNGLTITATVQSADLDGGTIWCIEGANVGQSRTITTHTSTTSLAVTVPFAKTIAVGDVFLASPWNNTGTATGGNDGITTLQTSTLFTQADASIASGTGGKVVIVDQELNGPFNSYVRFQLDDHIYKVTTV